MLSGGATGPTGPVGPAATSSAMALTVQVKPPDTGDWFSMPERDWARFGTYLKAIGDLPKAAHDAFLLYAGIAAGGFIALVRWGVGFVQASEHGVAAVIEGLVFVALTVITAGQAVINARIDKEIRSKVRRDAELLYEDM